MTIELKANSLVIDGVTMTKFHSRYALAQHMKAVLFGVP